MPFPRPGFHSLLPTPPGEPGDAAPAHGGLAGAGAPAPDSPLLTGVGIADTVPPAVPATDAPDFDFSMYDYEIDSTASEDEEPPFPDTDDEYQEHITVLGPGGMGIAHPSDRSRDLHGPPCSVTGERSTKAPQKPKPIAKSATTPVAKGKGKTKAKGRGATNSMAKKKAKAKGNGAVKKRPAAAKLKQKPAKQI